MAIKITNTEEKPLLARKEIKGEISFPEKATPSNNDIQSQIASEMKVDTKTVVVKHIYTSFGSCDAKVEAYVYNTVEDLKKIEPVTKAMKKKVEDAAKKAEEAKEAKAAEAEKPAEEAPKEEAKEAPAEEKKEEPKAEENPAEEKKE